MHRPITRVGVALAGALAMTAAWAWQVAPDDSPAPGPQSQVGASGMVIYRDPVTGEIGVPPPGAIPEPPVTDRAPRGELREVPSPVPGGGWKVDLGDRFLHSTSVTRGADGQIVTDCVPGSPGAEE